MNNVHLALVAGLATGILLGSAGCSHSSGVAKAPPSAPLTFILSVTVEGGGQLAPEEWAALRTTFQNALAHQGCRLIDEVAQADGIIRVQIYANENDAATGIARVVGIMRNPARVPDSPPAVAPGLGAATLLNALGTNGRLVAIDGFIDPVSRR
jgi:hypothetical protein